MIPSSRSSSTLRCKQSAITAGPSRPFRRPLTLRDTERPCENDDNFDEDFDNDSETDNPGDANNKGKAANHPETDDTHLATLRDPKIGTVYERGPTEAQFAKKKKTLPAATIGRKVLRPGPWAKLVMTTTFSVAVEGELIKSDLLISLREMPLKQELVLRFGRKVTTTGLTLIQEINKSITNVEAAHIQVVGTVKVGAAKRAHGPFAHCVTAPGAAACGNCHWRTLQHR